MGKRVPIFFSVNDAYVPYLGVTIYSILENASLEYEYDIHILHSGISEYNCVRLEALADEKTSIECVNVSENLGNKNFYGGPVAATKHISKEAFYRLLIPEIFPEYDKVIYLDCDLIVCGDIAELYETDLQGKTIGAVYSVEHWGENGPVLPNDDPHEWFNSGVMLIDVKRYLENGFVERCIEEMKHKIFNVVDQDLLRLVCYGETTYLPYEWNVIWHHLHKKGRGVQEYNRRLYEVAKKHPKIVHYTSGLKPWKMPGKELSEYFWKYARRTEFYEEIVFSNIETHKEESVDFSSYVFPFDKIDRKSSVILYGAGNVGRILKKQVEATKWCTLTAWADKDYESDAKRASGIISPEQIKKIPSDYILIAVEKEKVAEEICKELINIGIEEEKLIWADVRI